MLRKTINIILYLLSLLLLLSMTSCKSSDNESMPEGYQKSYSECKVFITRSTEITEPDKQTLNYSLDENGNLSLTHLDALFNCCPGRITSDITTGKNIIDIYEKEDKPGCHCNCRYDLNFDFINIKREIYKITIRSEYTKQLNFTLDLRSSTTGSVEPD